MEPISYGGLTGRMYWDPADVICADIAAALEAGSADDVTVRLENDQMIRVKLKTAGARLKAAFFNAFDEWPILEVRESHDDPLMEDIYGRFAITLDTQKLDRVDDNALYYVEHILRTVIEVGKDVSRNGSRKYSFSDTPDWWTPMAIDSIPSGRRVVHVETTF